MEKPTQSPPPARVIGFFIAAIIVINLVAVILSTVEPLEFRYRKIFYLVELISVVLFSMEYLVRLWAAPASPRFQGALRGRLKFALTPLAVVDLLAILPFFLPLFIPIDLRCMRVLRLVRMARLLKLGRYSESVQVLGRVLRSKSSELMVAATGVMFLLVISATLMYFVENGAQPEAFSSIPEAMWWGVITLTTVGYGDTTPVTLLGRILGGFVSVLGVGVFALPAGILSAGFAEATRGRRSGRLCESCQAPLDSAVQKS